MTTTNSQRDTSIFRRFHFPWSFFLVSILLWTVVTLPLALLLHEFAESGRDYAAMYSPFFIWPPIFMPFILFFLYRPISRYLQILETHATTRLTKKTLFLIFPIWFPILATLGAVSYEFMGPSIAPWEAHPNSPAFESFSFNIDQIRNLEMVSENVRNDRSWINLFNFNLKMWQYIQTHQDNVSELHRRAHAQGAAQFREILQLSNFSDNTNAKLLSSNTRFAYFFSFSILMFVAILVLTLLAVFTVLFFIGQRSKTQRVRQNFSFDFSFACFGAILFCYLSWIPLRGVTFTLKRGLYGEAQIIGEIIIIALFLVSFGFVVARWWGENIRTIVAVSAFIFTAVGAIPLFSAQASYFLISDYKFFILLALVYFIPSFCIWAYFSLRNAFDI